MKAFADYFSAHAARYREHRPDYPPALFAWLAQQAAGHDCAWDCATGNGQAALRLVDHFRRVIATDASQAQIEQAVVHPNIDYRCAPAEASGLEDASVDLITVAQAAHWFDRDRFHAEVGRVLRPGGVVALIGYGLFRVMPGIDTVVDHLYTGILQQDWPPQRGHIDNRYAALSFPYAEIAMPAFVIERQWTAKDCLDYLATWSAVQRHRQRTGRDPLQAIADDLAGQWGDGRRQVVWPMFARVGRVQ